MKSIRQRIRNKEITFRCACIEYYNDLTEKDVDYIVKKAFLLAAQHLNLHPFFTQKHVDHYVTNITGCAVTYLSHRFSKENIDYVNKHCITILKFKDIFL